MKHLAALGLAAVVTACAPAAHTPPSTNPAALDAVVDRHFVVINELDPAKRAALEENAYTDDIVFYDPGAASHGRVELGKAMDGIHQRFPGAVFRREAIQDRFGMVRVGWTLGRPGEAPVHRGEDIMRIEGGRIRELWVYIQPEPTTAKPVFAGIDHAGITVPDLAAATKFFHDVMGCEPMTSMGTFKSNDDWLKDHLGVDARTEVVGIAMLRCGYGSNIELLEYKDRTRRDAPVSNTELGAGHLAFYTSDLKGAIAHLKAHGIATMGEPFAKTSGDTGGETFVYFRAPWGLQLELTTFPEGKAYEKERKGPHLWSPLQPAE